VEVFQVFVTKSGGFWEKKHQKWRILFQNRQKV
jgi:hypothetical protein